MRKKGFVLKLFGILFLLLLITAGAAGYYFYNYHVFKEFRACLGEELDTTVSCENDLECESYFDLVYQSPEITELPPFALTTMKEIIDKGVYCEETCKVRELRGFDLEKGSVQEIDSCYEEEEEILIEIRGKEGLQVLTYLKDTFTNKENTTEQQEEPSTNLY